MEGIPTIGAAVAMVAISAALLGFMAWAIRSIRGNWISIPYEPPPMWRSETTTTTTTTFKTPRPKAPPPQEVVK